MLPPVRDSVSFLILPRFIVLWRFKQHIAAVHVDNFVPVEAVSFNNILTGRLLCEFHFIFLFLYPADNQVANNAQQDKSPEDDNNTASILLVKALDGSSVASTGAVKIARIIRLTIVTHFVYLLFVSMYSLYTWQSFCVKFIPIVKWDSIGAIRRRSKKEEAHCAPLGLFPTWIKASTHILEFSLNKFTESSCGFDSFSHSHPKRNISF